jgi:hypothetical protein
MIIRLPGNRIVRLIRLGIRSLSCKVVSGVSLAFLGPRARLISEIVLLFECLLDASSPFKCKREFNSRHFLRGHHYKFHPRRT